LCALESAHAVAHAIKLAKTMKKHQRVLVNLSGRGDKDVNTLMRLFQQQRGVSA
jgi:tryptophan synthase beta chain